jgi:hypothetical protein
LIPIKIPATVAPPNRIAISPHSKVTCMKFLPLYKAGDGITSARILRAPPPHTYLIQNYRIRRSYNLSRRHLPIADDVPTLFLSGVS